MSWFYLFVAGMCEIGFAMSMRPLLSQRDIFTVLTFVTFLILSFFFLTLSMKEIQTSTAYAIWTGIGTSGTVIACRIFFNEEIGPGRMIFLVMLIISIVGLKIQSNPT